MAVSSTGCRALQDRFDQLRAQQGKTNEPADVAPGGSVTLGQRLQRQRAAGGQLLKPPAPARDRLDQRRIAFRALARLIQSWQYQLGFDPAPLEGDCCRQIKTLYGKSPAR